MNQVIKITNSQDSVVIDIEGTIGIPEQWQFEEPQHRVATYETFRRNVEQIEQLNVPKVVVNIRSTGGDVNDALLIYDALSSLNASITTRCYGYVASAATVIAQAASEGQREISSNALYLIHNSQCSVEGSVEQLAQRMELLIKTDERLAQIYASRSGGDVEIYRELMAQSNGEGRWLSASECVELGLADRMVEVLAQEAQEESEPAQSESQESESQEGEESQESIVDRALKQVRGVVSQIGAQIKSSITQEERAPIAESGAESGAESVAKSKAVAIPAAAAPQRNISYSRASQIAFEEGQKSLSRTALSACEDPSLTEVRRSANQEAYSSDARRLVR